MVTRLAKVLRMLVPLLLTVGVLLTTSINALWGEQIDLAHHYSLVARLYELGSTP